MRYAKPDSIYEQKVQKIETLMRELGVRIENEHFYFEGSDKVFFIGDIELASGFSPGAASGFPRELESEVLFLAPE